MLTLADRFGYNARRMEGNGTLKGNRAKRLALPLLIIFLSLIPVWSAWRLHDRSFYDDSLITLTYAKNIARGNGFVFNHPPPVLGTTSPLFALLIAALSVLLPGLPMTSIAITFSCACWIGLLWLFFLFRNPLHLRPGECGVITAVLALSGWVTFLSFESYLFAFILILTLCLFIQRRYLLAGFGSTLLFLTRGEGILIFALMTLVLLFSKTQEPERDIRFRHLIRLLLGFFIPWVVWSGYALSTFGGIFPNTLSAKIIQGRMGLWKDFLPRLFREWTPAWIAPYSWKPFPWLNIWAIFTGLGIISIWKKHPFWKVLLAWIVAYIAGYSLLGVAAYPWYQVPVHFILHLLFAWGVLNALSFLGQTDGRWRIPLTTLILGAALVPLAAHLMKQVKLQMPTEKDQLMKQVAAWMKSNTSPGESIAYFEVGYLGYYTDNRVIDILGLVSPEMLRDLPGYDFNSGFWRAPTDYFLYSPFSKFTRPIYQDPRFALEYRKIKQFPDDRTFTLGLYQRKSQKETVR